MSLLGRLLEGEAEIRRKRNEIDFIVRTIPGLFVGLENTCIEISFKTNLPCAFFKEHGGKLCRWCIVNEGKNVSWVECWLTPWSGPLDMVFTTEKGAPALKLEEVGEVYETLSQFVDELTKQHPFILDRMRPFLDAADAIQK